MGDVYDAVLEGGGPWGIRLQGGKDFGVQLNVARVTPGSKAAIKGILAGDTITSINGTATDSLSHMDAQNAIKSTGQRLQLTLKKGKGVSLGEIKQVGSGGFAAQPNKTLYTTEVTHSAGVDHKYNSKPRAFGAPAASSGVAQTATAKKFDPSEYARRKKEELEKYKEGQNKPTVPDSDVLKMLQNTKVSDNNAEKGGGSFSKLQQSLNNEGDWAEKEKAFRMTADGTDLSGVSPGSQAVMDDIKNHGNSGLKTSGAPSGGSRSFKVLQQMTDNEEVLPNRNWFGTEDIKLQIEKEMDNLKSELDEAVEQAAQRRLSHSSDGKMKQAVQLRIRLSDEPKKQTAQHCLSRSPEYSPQLYHPPPLYHPPMKIPTSPIFKMTLEEGRRMFDVEQSCVIESLKAQIDTNTERVSPNNSGCRSPKFKQLSLFFDEQDKRGRSRSLGCIHRMGSLNNISNNDHGNSIDNFEHCYVVQPDHTSKNIKKRPKSLTFSKTMLALYERYVEGAESSPEENSSHTKYPIQNGGSHTRKQLQNSSSSFQDGERNVYNSTASYFQNSNKLHPNTSVKSFRNDNLFGRNRAATFHYGCTSFQNDLPPPPAELLSGGNDYNDYGFGSAGKNTQSGTFKMLQKHVDDGSGDQVYTVFDQAPGQRGQPVPAGQTFTPAARNTTERSNMPAGPNFRVGRASAPTFKSSSAMRNENKPPPPPAVNAGEVLNPNSKLYQGNQYPSSPPAGSGGSGPVGGNVGGSGGYQPVSFSPSAAPSNNAPYSGLSNNPPAAPSGSTHIIKSKGAPQPGPTPSSENELYCSACQQPLSGGPFVSAIGKTWHPEHFCCSSCNTSLQNQAFVEENDQLFCEKCYNSFYAPKCAHCSQAIIGNCINALGKSWHPDHFICSFCSRNFGSDGFLVDSGKPYCEKCFGDLFSVKCGKCMKPITGGEKYVEALNKNWHTTCFTCNQCNVRLEGGSFFMSGGMPYCSNHKGM